MTTTNNPQHSSLSNEHYTPGDVVEAARRTMGGIDLDPASCEIANTRLVRATEFYTERDAGHLQPWWGRVFLNPPGGRVDAVFRPVHAASRGRPACSETGACGLPPGHAHTGVTSSAKAWWRLLVSAWMRGEVEQAVFIGFSLEILQSSQVEDETGETAPALSVLHFPICVPRRRMRFFAPTVAGELVEGDQPTHANVLVYLPPRADGAMATSRFVRNFSSIGDCR